jgi:hypothetical protein
MLNVAVDGRAGIPLQVAAHDSDVAVYLSFGSQLDIAEHGDNLTVHFTVYVDTAHHGHGLVADPTARHTSVTQHRDNIIIDFARRSCRTKNGGHSICMLAVSQFRIAPDRYNVVFVLMVVEPMMMMMP